MIEQLNQHLLSYLNQIPLEIFSFVSLYLEEIVAIIPSSLVITAIGASAFEQGYNNLGLIPLILLGAISKTLGSLTLYFIFDKFEDFATKHFNKLFGVTHKQIEALGDKFKAKNSDFFFTLFIRSLPIFPTTPLSVIAGIIKLRLIPYALATLIGNIVRNTFFIYLGYIGLEKTNSLVQGSNRIEDYLQSLLFVVIVAVFVWWRLKKK